MKIQKVKIQRFKVLKDVELDMQGKNILLIGENGLGKSSVMQFIGIALGDKSNIPPEAEGSGMIIASKNNGNYTFKVQFKDGKPVVEVTSPDGLKDTRKGVIAEIVGAMGFDIDEFVNLSDTEAGRKKQVEIFKSMLPEDVKEFLRGEENKIQNYYDDRTELNRTIKTLEGYLKEQPMWGEDLEVQPVDVSDLQQKVEKATEHNNKILGVKQRITERKNTLTRNNTDLDELRAKIARIEAENKELEKQNTEAEKWLGTVKEVDVTALNAQIADATTVNTKYAQAQELKKKQETLRVHKENSENYTVMIETGRQLIADTIRDMDSIVPGLSFDSEQLLWKGVPVSTASLSTSEIIELGVRLKMAQNPDLGVLFIEHGESLGSKRLKEIQKLAKENDWQIILEQVERGQEELKIEIMGE